MSGTIWRMIAVNSHVSMCMKWETYCMADDCRQQSCMSMRVTSVYLLCALEI